MDITSDSIYQTIKSLEGQFDPPAPYFPITVGTFDVDTGQFSGLMVTSETDPEPIEHGPHDTPHNPPPKYVGQEWVSVTINSRWQRTITKTPAPQTPLQPVLLFFSISHAVSDTWSVMVNGVTLMAIPGQTTIRVDIWDSQVATWTINANGHSHSDTLRIQRSTAKLTDMSAGAFTIPVLPVTIIYAPPVDSGKQSTASYSQSDTHGNTVTFDTSTETSATAPVEVFGTATFKLFLDSTKEALTAAGDDVAAKAFELISSQIGDVSSSQTNGISDEDQISMTLSETDSAGLATSAAAGGPGVGDIIHYFHNIRMVWAYGSGGLRLCPVGFQHAAFPVNAIKNNLSQVGISLADAQALLSLDPFATSGPSAALPPDRFEQIATWEYGFGLKATFTKTISRETKNQTTHQNYTTTTSGWEAGPILKELGFGGSDTTTFKISNATGTDVTSSVTVEADLVAGPEDHFVVNLCYDQLFGSFAFQVEQPATSARLKGHGAKPNELVTLTAGGKEYNTVANKNGEYAFYAKSIPVGHATIKVGNKAGTQIVIS